MHSRGTGGNISNRHGRTQRQCNAANSCLRQIARKRRRKAISRRGCYSFTERCNTRRWKLGTDLRRNAKNVTIEGPGTIDGQGAQFYSAVPGSMPPGGLSGDRRPYHLLFYRCENLVVQNIEMLDSAYHSIRVIQSKRVRMDGIYIYNCVNYNNDGFYFISAQYVTISNCIVQSLDDACALFGSCKYVTVTNCSFSTRWSVFRFGSGFAENISISNCLLYQFTGARSSSRQILDHGLKTSHFQIWSCRM